MSVHKIIVPIVLFVVSSAIGQKKDFPLRLHLTTDLTIAGSNLALVGLNHILPNLLSVPQADYIESLDRNQLFFIDRETYREFNNSTERLSHYTMLSTMALPAILAPVVSSGGQLVTLGVIGMETYISTYLFIQSLKLIARRPRPEMYADSYDQMSYTGINSLNSFPSRHAALAFSAAGFVHACQPLFIEDYPWIKYLTYGTYGAAFSAGFLRYHSGVHHLTDVIVGAALGWCIGYMVPTLHIRRTSLSPVEISFAPNVFGRHMIHMGFNFR